MCAAVIWWIWFSWLHCPETREAARLAHTGLMRLITEEDDSDVAADGTEAVLDVGSVVQVLMEQMVHEHMQPRIAALRWIYHLHIKTPKKVRGLFD